MATILVTLDLNGCTGPNEGVIASPVLATVGDRFDVAVTFAVGYYRPDEGYFYGWFTDAGSEVLPSHTVPVSDVTLHARVVLYGFSNVTFAENGGEPVVPVGMRCRTGRAYTFGGASLPVPTHSNPAYAFAGWWTTPENGGVRVFDGSAVLAGDYTLYARWSVPIAAPTGYWERAAEDTSWVLFDKVVFAENLPEGLAEAYAVWLLSAASKSARVDFIVSGVLLDFRSAIAADEHPTGAANPTAVPIPCLRHMQMMCWYFLGLECGYSGVGDLRAGWQDAEVYLRSLASSTRMGTNRFAYEDGAGGVPLYSGADGRVVSGGGAVSGGAPLVGGDTGGGVNYFAPG